MQRAWLQWCRLAFPALWFSADQGRRESACRHPLLSPKYYPQLERNTVHNTRNRVWSMSADLSQTTHYLLLMRRRKIYSTPKNVAPLIVTKETWPIKNNRWENSAEQYGIWRRCLFHAQPFGSSAFLNA
jgi:hypothetical protein